MPTSDYIRFLLFHVEHAAKSLSKPEGSRERQEDLENRNMCLSWANERGGVVKLCTRFRMVGYCLDPREVGVVLSDGGLVRNTPGIFLLISVGLPDLLPLQHLCRPTTKSRV